MSGRLSTIGYLAELDADAESDVAAVAVGVGVGVGAPDCAQYLPPVSKKLISSGLPPQTIISLPVHTAV